MIQHADMADADFSPTDMDSSVNEIYTRPSPVI